MSNNDNNLANKLNGVSKSFHYSLPQEVRDLLAQAATVIAAKSSNINTTSLTVDGNPNLHNERVLAALLDTIGTNFTNICNEMATNGGRMTQDHANVFVQLHHVMRKMRDVCGIGTDWTPYSQAELVLEVTKEIDAHNRRVEATAVSEFRDACIAAGVDPNHIDSLIRETYDAIGVRRSASDVADEILADLRASGDLDRRAV
jgi:hypothetical protein